MNKILKLFFFLFLIVGNLKKSYCQEELVPLAVNPVLKNVKVESAASLRDALSLPFLDDFSYYSTYPDQNKWADKQAFVNSTFPINPISIGVATLDGLKENGQPYDSISHSFSSIGGADTLTSQPILLGSNLPADSVYFSFFYQPGGLGDYPNSYFFNSTNYGVNVGDSLVVEFKDSTGTWQHVWSKDGVFSNEDFKQVMIPLKNSIYFHNDFQFRFRNYGTLIGQFDCWHIDYVKLNSNRSFTDVIITDVAMQFLPSSMLKNYQSMPWNQFQNFQTEEKADAQFISVKNNFTVEKNTSRSMSATETVTGTPLFSSGTQSSNLDAGTATSYSFAVPIIQDFALDSLNIASTFIIGATGDNNTANDTATRNQLFSNFMAYDDGTAEATYRLLGSPASLALEYHLNTPDTLQGIEIMFAHDEVNVTQSVISIYVWSSLNPEDSLLRDEFLLPEYPKDRNGFALYRLSRPLLITGTFYIGWQQVSLQTDLKIDIGFDKNDTANQHLFYNIDGNWTQSQLVGAAMLRPVIGSKIPFGVGVQEINTENEFTIFPNPANDVVIVKGGNEKLLLEVLDLTSRKILSANSTSQINIENLNAGLYLLKITDLQSGEKSIQKFIKGK